MPAPLLFEDIRPSDRRYLPLRLIPLLRRSWNLDKALKLCDKLNEINDCTIDEINEVKPFLPAIKNLIETKLEEMRDDNE